MPPVGAEPVSVDGVLPLQMFCAEPITPGCRLPLTVIVIGSVYFVPQEPPLFTRRRYIIVCVNTGGLYRIVFPPVPPLTLGHVPPLLVLCYHWYVRLIPPAAAV